MAEILTMVSVVSFIAAGVFLLLTILFFVVFKIPFVIGELTGRNAKKSIVQQRTSNERAEAKKNLMQQMEQTPERKRAKHTSSLLDEAGTAVLADEVGTAVLADEAGTAVLADEAGTAVLADEAGTAVLTDVEMAEPLQYEEEEAIALLEEVIFIHTDEVIA